MTDFDFELKQAEVDRLLNDPGMPIRPLEVWDLLAEISSHAKMLELEQRGLDRPTDCTETPPTSLPS